MITLNKEKINKPKKRVGKELDQEKEKLLEEV